MNRIRAYRAIEGLSQQELGELLGISGPMVSAIESGRKAIADISPLGYSNERIDLPDMSEPLHRQRASTPMAARQRAQELLRLAGEVFSELRDRTERTPYVAIERLSPSFENLEEQADDLRTMLQQEPSGPIRNLTVAVERAGVCVIPIVGLPGVDGLSSWVNGVPVVGLSPAVPGDRFRLSLGHELGHLLLHTRRTDSTESEANRFSGALLIPLSDFDAAMPDRPMLSDFIALKKSWGVSVAALVYRAHDLGYIDDQRYRALQIQMSKWHKSEPATFQPVNGQLFKSLVDANGGVDDVAKDIGINRGHLAELTNWSHLRLHVANGPERPSGRTRFAAQE